MLPNSPFYSTREFMCEEGRKMVVSNVSSRCIEPTQPSTELHKTCGEPGVGSGKRAVAP